MKNATRSPSGVDERKGGSQKTSGAVQHCHGGETLDQIKKHGGETTKGETGVYLLLNDTAPH